MTSLLPDPASLADQLENARGARDHLDRVISWLEQGLQLLGAHAGGRAHELIPDPPPLDAVVPERQPEELPAPAETLPIIERDPEQQPVVPAELEAGSDSASSFEVAKPERPAKRPPAPRPRSAAQPVSRPGVRDRDAKILSAILTANRPMAKQQLAELLGLEREQVTEPLTRLLKVGKVVATGTTKDRRYEPAGYKPHSEAGARSEAGRKRNATKLTDAVSRVGLRDRVMKAISADPCALDNNRLAQALDADLEDIGDACSYLVGKGRLQLAEDGTYLRSVAEAAREIAAA